MHGSTVTFCSQQQYSTIIPNLCNYYNLKICIPMVQSHCRNKYIPPPPSKTKRTTEKRKKKETKNKHTSNNRKDIFFNLLPFYTLPFKTKPESSCQPSVNEQKARVWGHLSLSTETERIQCQYQLINCCCYSDKTIQLKPCINSFFPLHFLSLPNHMKWTGHWNLPDQSYGTYRIFYQYK